MPLMGFKCPRDGSNKKFDECFLKCSNKCEPLPVLLALGEERTHTAGRFSVTEILNPPQSIYYSRNFPYYATPQSLVWATFGKAWHWVLEVQKKCIVEMGLQDEYLIEEDNKFEVVIPTPAGDAVFSGRPDMYVVSSKTLWDFKTMKYYYTLKYLLEKENWDETNYHWQVNLYRLHRFPEATSMKLYVLVKDWNSQVKDIYGIPATVVLDVPFIRDEVLKEKEITALEYNLRCESGEIEPRPCADEEIWISKKTGIPLRCREYCSAADNCPQWREFNARKQAESFNERKK